MSKIVDVFYIILLGTALGSTFALAAFVAPAIFHSDIALGREILSHFQEGLVMTAVFKKYCALLNVIVIAILVKEGVELAIYKKKDYFRVGTALVVTISSLLFTSYFTPKIIEAQAEGQRVITQSGLFEPMHRASVFDFSVILVSLAVLLAKVSLQTGSRLD